jgi:Tol biopolymer transport system component
MCETGPAVAPGGSTVAVSLELDDIAVIDLATSGLRRLTDDSATLDGSPAWSPDGSQIVFFRGPEMGPSHIYVTDADGTDVRQLTQGSRSDEILFGRRTGRESPLRGAATTDTRCTSWTPTVRTLRR